MSQQSAHGSDPPPRTPTAAAGVAATDAATATTDHRPQPAPTEYRCTCGRLREACLHDAITALWLS